MLKLNTARMREVREGAGLTQIEAARRAKMTPSRWNDIESGGRGNVTIETLGNIADALDCPAAELLTDSKRTRKTSA